MFAVQMCRSLAQKEGMLVGGSAGLNLHAAVEISKTAKPGSVIVAILADNGVKYLTKIYNNDWIKAKVCCHCMCIIRVTHDERVQALHSICRVMTCLSAPLPFELASRHG